MRQFSISSILVLGGGCGVDVGNPNKPVYTPLPSIAEQEQLALISTDYLEETFLASGDDLSSITGETVTFTDRKCTIIDTFNVSTEGDISENTTSAFPEDAPVYSIAIKSTKLVENSFSTDDQGLSCGPQGLVATFNWTKLNGYTMNRKIERTTERTTTEISTSAITEHLTTKASGTRLVTFSKVLNDAEGLVLNKTVKFNSNIVRKKEVGAAVTESSNDVGTLKELTIVETRKSSGLKSHTIQSGSVSSNYENSQYMVLEYDNLHFKNSASCRPNSGAIHAQIYSDVNKTSLVYQYSIDFVDGKATLSFDEATKRTLRITECLK